MSMIRLVPGMELEASYAVIGTAYDASAHDVVLIAQGFVTPNTTTNPSVSLSKYGLAGYVPVFCYGAYNSYDANIAVDYDNCTTTKLAFVTSAASYKRLYILVVGWKAK